MLTRADIRWIVGLSAAMALLLLAYQIPVLGASRVPSAHGGESGWIGRLQVRQMQPPGGTRYDALDIGFRGEAVRNAIGKTPAELLFWLISAIAGGCAVWLLYLVLTAISSNIVARYGVPLFLFQGFILGEIAAEPRMALAVPAAFGIVYFLWLLQQKGPRQIQTPQLVLIGACLIAGAAWFWELSYGWLIWMILIALFLWPYFWPKTIDQQQRARFGGIAAAPLAILIILLIFRYLGDRPLLASSELSWTAIGIYGPFNEPGIALSGSLIAAGSEWIRFWSSVLNPVGLTADSPLLLTPLIGLFALLALVVRIAGEQQNGGWGVFSILGLFILIAPVAAVFLPSEQIFSSLIPLLALIVLLAVLGMEQFSGLFGARAPGVFKSLMLVLIFISAVATARNIAATWHETNRLSAEAAQFQQSVQAMTGENEIVAATALTPALAIIERPVIPLDGVHISTPQGVRKLDGPGEWFEYMEGLFTDYRPRAMISRQSHWPYPKMFEDLLLIWPDRPADPLVAFSMEWENMQALDHVWTDPVTWLEQQQEPLPDWALGLSLVDMLDVADLVSEAEHRYRYRAKTAPLAHRRSILEGYFYPQSKPLQIWDGGRRIWEEEQFLLNAPYDDNPAVLIFRSDNSTSTTVSIRIGDYETSRTFPAPFKDEWGDVPLVIPKGAIKPDKNGRVTVTVRPDVVKSRAPLRSYHYWFYQAQEPDVELAGGNEQK